MHLLFQKQEIKQKLKTNDERRVYGAHLTSIDIFKEFILPEIKDKLNNFTWVDLFCGEGNLILPILNEIQISEREEFFKEHIFIFDVKEEMVKKARENAIKYGISKELTEKNIVQQDTLKNYPEIKTKFPIFHITNPPYLYLGYISKYEETQNYLQYFKGKNDGYQDLYQIGLINDLRNKINNMIYIIPSNFLFGFSVSNKIRDDFLKEYYIKKSIIFERQIFEFTGTNVAICFFERKNKLSEEDIIFEGIKINKEVEKKIYTLKRENHYRAGNEFDGFVEEFKSNNPIELEYYLNIEEVGKNKGSYEIKVIDVSNYKGNEYEKKTIFVNEILFDKIKSNILFVRTIDTGSKDGRVGLYEIKEIFGVDGILVTKEPYRTQPIQIFFKGISEDEQILLKNYFNLMIEYLREKTDSEFLTTYKYSNANYTRKYLGLSQTRKLIQTFPNELSKEEKEKLKELISQKNVKEVISFLNKKKEKKVNAWF